jgi:hypothetical protein
VRNWNPINKVMRRPSIKQNFGTLQGDLSSHPDISFYDKADDYIHATQLKLHSVYRLDVK